MQHGIEIDNLVWNTKKSNFLFNNWKHFGFAIPGSNCSYTRNYVGKTKRNETVQWKEPKDKTKFMKR